VRERLTLAFVGLALVLMSVAGVVRGLAVADITRTGELDHLGADARFVAKVVESRYETGEEVTAVYLDGLVAPETQLTVEHEGEETLVAEGSGFSVGELGEPLEVTQSIGGTTVTAVESDQGLRQITSDNLSGLAALLLALVVLAGLAGFVLAGRMSRPFRALADGAAALGRGRFDIDLPASRVPEVAAIATALQSSAVQLRESISRDREFLQHASHVLRTPLTGMRLELEELTLAGELDEADVRRTAARCVAEVQRLDQTVGELLDFARSRSLVSGAEVSLLDLGARLAQRWRDELGESRRVRAFVDTGGELTLTPGPVEQLLDSVLRDVSVHGSGPVELRFAGQEDHLKVSVSTGPARTTGDRERNSAASARTITEVLGGRYSGDPAAGGLDILLPRR
jgi:signal transduction histidine kinase